MSSVSSVVSSSLASTYDVSGMQRRQRPDSAKMAEDLFSKLDSTGKGYIEESDLTSALSGLSSSDGTASASEIFSQLDSDSDGKVTETELSSSLEKLAQSLDNQFNQMRMQGAMPPPPPKESESSDGFTKDELTTQLSAISSTDTAESSLLSKIVENFDAADTNEDGKVSLQEALAYDQSSQSTASTSTSSSSDTTTSATASTTTEKSDAQVFRQLMDLLRTYGTEDGSSQGIAASLLSISA